MLTKEEKTDSLETQTNRNIIAKTKISILKSLNVQGRHDKMKLQAALDFDYRSANEAQTKEHPVDLAIFWSELAKKLVSEAKESIDIIEVGTPFVMEYGLAPVKELKAAFPEKTILADLKIADAGYYEAAAAFKNGADIATVLAVTDDATIRNAVAAAREYGCAIMVDMLAVPNLPERLTQVDAMGVDYICLHTSKDLQRLDKDMSKSFEVLRSYVKNAKLAIAGGINRGSIEKFVALRPDVIIVGEGITGAEKYCEAAAFFKAAMEAAKRREK